MVSIDPIKMYEDKKKKFGLNAYKHVSELLAEAKELHRRNFVENPSPQGDFEQSWKPVKGNMLEKLITHILEDEVASLGLRIVRGKRLDKSKSQNLSKEMSLVKRNLTYLLTNVFTTIPAIKVAGVADAGAMEV